MVAWCPEQLEDIAKWLDANATDIGEVDTLMLRGGIADVARRTVGGRCACVVVARTARLRL